MERSLSVRPLGTAAQTDAIDRTRENELITVRVRSDGSNSVEFLNAAGALLGHVTARHGLAKELQQGRVVTFARFTGRRNDGVTIRVTTGDPGDTVSPYTLEWHARIMGEASDNRPRSNGPYYVNIVGESYWQDEIARCSVGEEVILAHDTNNSHDPRAIAVVGPRYERIGFLPRDGWLTRALIDEKHSYKATISDLHQASGERLHIAVVLSVNLD